jgi:hypothetical protein
MTPTAWDFRNRLTIILNTARQSGQSYIDVESDNLHKEAGGHSNSKHRMPVCRDVMIKMMRSGDSVLKEHEETLMIRYVLGAKQTGSLSASVDS